MELREQVDLDSLDFVNFAEALRQRFGIVVPARDYPELLTLDSISAYLARRGATSAAGDDRQPWTDHPSDS